LVVSLLLFGIRQFGDKTDLQRFRRGKPASIHGRREFLEWLSCFCDKVFDKPPQFRNELVNRHSLSSAALAALRPQVLPRTRSPGEGDSRSGKNKA
jgi:hypothetical protein